MYYGGDCHLSPLSVPRVLKVNFTVFSLSPSRVHVVFRKQLSSNQRSDGNLLPMQSFALPSTCPHAQQRNPEDLEQRAHAKPTHNNYTVPTPYQDNLKKKQTPPRTNIFIQITPLNFLPPHPPHPKPPPPTPPKQNSHCYYSPPAPTPPLPLPPEPRTLKPRRPRRSSV